MCFRKKTGVDIGHLAAYLVWGCLFVYGGACLESAAQSGAAAAAEHYRSASRLYKEGRYAQAIEELTLSLRLKPDQPRTARLLGISYQLTGNLSEAEKAFLHAIRFDATDAEAWFFLGRVRYEENFFEPARDTLGKALRLDPGSTRAREYLALTLEAEGDTGGALGAYQEACELSARLKKPSWTLHLEYGTLLHKLNRVEESEKQLLMARGLNPSHWQAHFELGKLYLETGQHDSAARELIAALAASGATEEDTARICRVLVRVYYAMGREQDALKVLALAEKSKP